MILLNPSKITVTSVPYTETTIARRNGKVEVRHFKPFPRIVFSVPIIIYGSII